MSVAELIDISQFRGVKTHADVEDLNDVIAQNIENLKIVEGQLVKTFAAGEAGIPVFPLTQINTKLSGSYSVKNVHTFISEKFTVQEHRYIVAIVDNSNVLKLFWYDPSLPDATDHLQIEDNILIFTTDGDSGLAEDGYVAITDVKDNASTPVAIANTDVYDTIDYKTGNKHYINTDSATAWGGSFFATAQSSGCRDVSYSGKHATHLTVDVNASGGISSFTNIALLALNGKVLCMYSYDSGSAGRIKYTIGGVTAELNTTLYNQFKAYSTFKVNAMTNHSNAIWVYYSAYNGSGYRYNAVVKYTVQSSGTIVETGFDGHDPAESDWGETAQTFDSGFFYTANTGDLYLMVPDNDPYLYKMSSSTVSGVNGRPSQTGGYTWRGLTSIVNTVSGSKEYLVLGESSSSNHKFHYIDLNNGSASWANTGAIAEELLLMTKMDFGENSNKNESIVKYYQRSNGDKFLQYSTHNDATVILSWASVHNTFTTSTVITAIKNAYRHPSGTKYLMICTNDSGVYNDSGNPMVHGIVYRVDASKAILGLNNNANNTYKDWNPTCIDDVVTGTGSGNQFFEHAKAYIQAYGVEYIDTSSNPKSALNRITDIGWASNTWAGTGSLDYKWIDITSKYSFPEINESNSSSSPTFYHKQDKNPIVVTNDTIRFIPGSIGKVGANEAKGLWLGYINRSLFNNAYAIPSNWYGYSNVLNNPFQLVTQDIYKTNNDMRGGNSVKYNCTAIYDGIQETLFNKTKELILTETNINKSIIEVKAVIADVTQMNKRITGINVYRSIGTGGVYGTFQLIGHMTFVDTNNDLSSVGTLKEVSGKFFKNHIAHIKVDDSSAVSSIVGLSTSETFLGNNKYALEISGGFDGIDSVGEGEDSLQPFFTTSGTVRAIAATSTTKIVVSQSSIISNNTKYIIGNEGVQTSAGAIVTNQTISTGISTNATLTWTANPGQVFPLASDPTNIIKVGDIVRLDGTHVDIVVTAVTANNFTATPAADRSGITAAVVNLRNVASPQAIVEIVRGQSINFGAVSYSGTNTATTHLNNTEILRIPSVNYVKVTVDDDANFNNTYLDSNGDFNGSSWKIKEKSWGKYSTVSEEATGAYSGSSVGFLQLNNFATDFQSGLSQNQLSGSIVQFGESSFQIEGNSAYQSDLGGCWIKTTESIDKLDNANFAGGVFTYTGKLLEGFSISTASGSSTPGMGYTKAADKITITCRDFRLDDLGTSPVQTVYSNRVNGQYAKIVKSRLFLGNVYLNPDDKAEERQDYVAYSEINQFDTIPVSNVIAFEDREGGAVTGLASLFNRLVIFKPQAIFILSMPDPTSPTTWQIVESKHNIGNIAPRAVVEVHDSVYFVYHDGIYEISANMAASSTATPSVMNKISADIEDQFMANTSKVGTKGIYDPNRQEIVFRWLESATEKVWSYNYVLKTWRKIDMGSFNLTLLNYDENGSPLNYDLTTNKIIKFDANNASITKWKSKRFPLDLHRKRLVRYMTIQYTGSDSMTANVYLDGASSASYSKTGLSAGTTRFPVKRYANRVELELTSPSSTNALTIKRLQLEVE